MKRAVIKVEIDDHSRPVSRGDILDAMIMAQRQIAALIRDNLPGAYDVNRKVSLAFALEDD